VVPGSERGHKRTQDHVVEGSTVGREIWQRGRRCKKPKKNLASGLGTNKGGGKISRGEENLKISPYAPSLKLKGK